MSESLRTAALRAEIERCRQLVDPLLLDPSRQAAVAPEHLRRAVVAYLERPAKRLRPALLMLCCRALGGDERQALPAAAAVELFHTWTLVHDDVIDNDAVRRGQPTVHTAAAAWARRDFGAAPAAAAAYGRDVAILAGDVQQAWSNAMLLSCARHGVPATLVLALCERLQTVLNHRLLEGEMLDVQFSLQPLETITEEAVLRMLHLKTGVLLEFAATTGGAIARGRLPDEDAAVAALGRFAGLCGLAFQLQDDILGIVGDEKALGKPIGSDLREGKVTVIVLHALRHASSAQRAVLGAALGRPDADAATVAAAQAGLVDLGSIAYAHDLANGYVRQALGILHEAVPAGPARDLLETWAESTVARAT